MNTHKLPNNTKFWQPGNKTYIQTPLKTYIFWGILHTCILILLIWKDETLYKHFHQVWAWAHTNKIPVLYELTKTRHWEFFKQFGSAWTGILFALFICIYDKQKKDSIPVLLISSALTGFGYFFIKHMVGKIRPVVTDGVPAYHDFPDAWWVSNNLAFPSGHTAFAFTIATYLSVLYPPLWKLFYPLAALCALSRVISHSHYFSDIYAGAMLGIGVTLLSFYFYSRGGAQKETALPQSLSK